MQIREHRDRLMPMYDFFSFLSKKKKFPLSKLNEYFNLNLKNDVTYIPKCFFSLSYKKLAF